MITFRTAVALFVIAAAAGAAGLPPADLRRVHGQSMAPSLQSGDLVLLHARCRDAVCGRPLRGGDIVVIHLAGERRPSRLKRVVPLAGDTVEMRAGRIFVGGRPLPEPYVARGNGPRTEDGPGSWHLAHLLPGHPHPAYRPTGLAWGPVVVPPRSLLVLGDNRRDSGDSRELGPIRVGEVRGRVIARIPRAR